MHTSKESPITNWGFGRYDSLSFQNLVFGDEALQGQLSPLWMPSLFVLSEGISGAVELLTTGPWAEVRRRPRPMKILKMSCNIATTCREFLATYQAHLVSP